MLRRELTSVHAVGMNFFVYTSNPPHCIFITESMTRETFNKGTRGCSAELKEKLNTLLYCMTLHRACLEFLNRYFL